MPIEFSLETGSKYFVSRWIGRVSDSELIPGYRAFLESGEWTPGLCELADLSGADMSSVSPGALKSLAAWFAQEYARWALSHVATAVYAPRDLPFGLARMYQAMADRSPENVRVFRDRADGIAWLEQRAGEIGRK